jgi:transaldolase
MQIELSGSRLHDLRTLGQSVWLDCCNPCTLVGPQFAHLIRDGIAGIDANPAGLATVYSEDATYREAVLKLREAGAAAPQIYERLRIEDLRRAADRLRRVFGGRGRDGYACVDLSPGLAHDADGTESEASRLWRVIDRPNIMMKVPATDAGLVAMRRLIASGINVNATLIFGARRYREVIEAHLSGLEDRIAERLSIESVASVASVLVGHIDIAVDRELEAIQKPAKAVLANGLRGKAAVAVAQFAYQKFKSVVASPRWRTLAAFHAQPQRLLWTSMDIHEANGSELKYVNALIGRDTVTAMSPSTLDAYLDHGIAAPTIERKLQEVLARFGELAVLGIDLDRVSMQLESETLSTIEACLKTALARLASAR